MAFFRPPNLISHQTLSFSEKATGVCYLIDLNAKSSLDLAA